MTRPRPPGRRPFSSRTVACAIGSSGLLLIAACGQGLDVEALARIENPVQQHATGPDTRNPHGTVRVELAAPFNRVAQKFPKGLRDRLTDLRRQAGFELQDERVQPIGHLDHARDDDLDPLGPGGNHFDREGRIARRRERLRHDLHNRHGGHRLGDVAVGLPADGGEQRLRRVVGGDDDDDRRPIAGAHAREQVEAAHARQTHVQEHQLDLLPGEVGQRGRPVARLDHGVALTFE